jgi:cyclohexanecarboxylate-CoA ligase
MDEDGYIRITGRSKDIIIRGGENIPVVEVEQLLYRHDAVADVAIVGMPDERLGERSCAFVSFTEGETLSFKGLVDYLKSCDITTQYLPERLEIIDTFPRTMSGKIQKFRLREIAQSLTPQSNND